MRFTLKARRECLQSTYCERQNSTSEGENVSHWEEQEMSTDCPINSGGSGSGTCGDTASSPYDDSEPEEQRRSAFRLQRGW